MPYNPYNLRSYAYKFGLAASLLRLYWFVMTSSNGNNFRVTGPLCGEFTGQWWIPRTPVTWSSDVFFELRPNKELQYYSFRSVRVELKLYWNISGLLAQVCSQTHAIGIVNQVMLRIIHVIIDNDGIYDLLASVWGHTYVTHIMPCFR